LVPTAQTAPARIAAKNPRRVVEQQMNCSEQASNGIPVSRGGMAIKAGVQRRGRVNDRASKGNGARNDRVDSIASREWRRAGRLEALRGLSVKAAKVTWSPTLLRLVIEELFVEEDFVRVCGDPRTFPVHQYPQGILVALGARHSWRQDDLKRFARRAGLRDQASKRR
jgi:hypothetical protein